MTLKYVKCSVDSTIYFDERNEEWTTQMLKLPQVDDDDSDGEEFHNKNPNVAFGIYYWDRADRICRFHSKDKAFIEFVSENLKEYVIPYSIQ